MKKVKDLALMFGNLFGPKYNNVDIKIKEMKGPIRYSIHSNNPMIAKIIGLLVYQDEDTYARVIHVDGELMSHDASCIMEVGPKMPMPTMKNMIRRTRYIQEILEKLYPDPLVSVNIDNINVGNGKKAMDNVIAEHSDMLKRKIFKVTAYITIELTKTAQVHISIISDSGELDVIPDPAYLDYYDVRSL